ncbi:MAG: caspase family protein [Hydrococcus sp. Prado102]|jgi:hypothetical protein|nr:caspase family protein [Hydrococcus sp. Prado102]
MSGVKNTQYRKAMYEEDEESEPYKKGRLLVVALGINKYKYWQTLKNAVQDAVGFQQALIDKLGFTAPIEPLINERATKIAINSLVEEQLREILQEDDSLILFFAGHGHTRVDRLGSQTIETGYLIPVEASGSNKYSEYIEIDPFLKSVAKLPAKHILVILDSCHSGFALGEVKQYRDAVTYTKDLSNKVSRRVITSALREQPALDGGPIPGHSLFTGTLINGFNWGEADLDGNGLISSSELGLFIQQKVGQASESKQTPDFGAFHWDDRGEMIISLCNQSFDALKARAFSVLQAGEFSIFKELVGQLIELKPFSPETLYLEYRLRFSENNFERVIEIVDTLLALNPSERLIPLSQSDLWDIRGKLYCWTDVLAIPETSFALEVTVLVRDAKETPDELEAAKEIKLGDSNGYLIEHKKVFRLSMNNPTEFPMHIYMIEIDSNGCFETVILWRDEEILFNGLPPGETHLTYPFVQTGSVGTCELRLFSSPKRLPFFLFPASASARSGSIETLEEEDLKRIEMKTIRYSMTQKLV